MKKFKQDERAIELPIKIVVMLVVAWSRLRRFYPSSQNPRRFECGVSSIEIDDGANSERKRCHSHRAENTKVRVFARVFDKNNNPVEKASITITEGVDSVWTDQH